MRKVILVVGLIGLAACSEPSTYRPYVDLPGSNRTTEQYEVDVKACQQRVRMVSRAPRDAGEWALYGAAVGASAGAIGGAVTAGNIGTAAGIGAGIGASAGALYAVGGDYYAMVADMQNCMTAKGYVVLG